MKRLAIILLALLIAVPAFGASTIHRRLEPETVTASTALSGVNPNWFDQNQVYRAIKHNEKIVSGPTSVAAGSALMDLTTANAFAAPATIDLTAYQTGNYIAHFQAGGLVCAAWISATAPGGLDTTEIISAADDRNFATDTGWWSKASGVTIPADGKCSFTAVAQYGALNKTGQHTAGALYLASFEITDYTSGAVRLLLGGTSDGINRQSVGSFTSYGTATTGGSIGIMNYSATAVTLKFTNISYLKINTPAATGALLLSTKGGSRGWLIAPPSGWNGNAAVTVSILAAY